MLIDPLIPLRLVVTRAMGLGVAATNDAFLIATVGMISTRIIRKQSKLGLFEVWGAPLLRHALYWPKCLPSQAYPRNNSPACLGAALSGLS